jgi:signal transduction histidine kinase
VRFSIGFPMRRLWEWVTAAPPGTGGAEARRACLLAAILAVLIPLGTISVTAQLALVSGFLPTFVAVMAAISILGVAWVVNRCGHRGVAASLTAMVTSAAAIAAAAANPADAFALAFALLGVLLASTLVTTWVAGVVAATSIASVLALAWLRPAIPTSIVIAAAAFLMIGSALIIVNARHRDLLEADRLREERRAQRQLERADRLTSLGTLATTLAHEINNPLAYVMANLDILADRTRDHVPGEDQELIEQCRFGIGRIAAIARGMNRFARGDDRSGGAVDVTRALDAALMMAEPQIRARARLVKQFEPVPLACGNAGLLEQAFLNVLLNAVQATPEGQPHRHEIVVRLGVDDQGSIEVEVCDTGSGIPPDAIERVFEPFFSTKPVGEGTGLGLSVCHGIVTSCGGRITASNRPGSGAMFRIGLPRAPEQTFPTREVSGTEVSSPWLTAGPRRV